MFTLQDFISLLKNALGSILFNNEFVINTHSYTKKRKHLNTIIHTL